VIGRKKGRKEEEEKKRKGRNKSREEKNGKGRSSPLQSRCLCICTSLAVIRNSWPSHIEPSLITKLCVITPPSTHVLCMLRFTQTRHAPQTRSCMLMFHHCKPIWLFSLSAHRFVCQLRSMFTVAVHARDYLSCYHLCMITSSSTSVMPHSTAYRLRHGSPSLRHTSSICSWFRYGNMQWDSH